jgi:hypothetical protein
MRKNYLLNKEYLTSYFIIFHTVFSVFIPKKEMLPGCFDVAYVIPKKAAVTF